MSLGNKGTAGLFGAGVPSVNPDETLTNSGVLADGLLDNQEISNLVEGDLGQRFMTLKTYIQSRISIRDTASLVGMQRFNHRFSGHRESHKFLYTIQKVLLDGVSFYKSMRLQENTLKSSEVVDIYPTDTEIAIISHVMEQIRFKEWLLLRSDNIRWFV